LEFTKYFIYTTDDHGFLVEPSCGVTLASIYSKVLPAAIEKNENGTNGPIVLIVCGGSDMSHEILSEFAATFELTELLMDSRIEIT